MQFWFSKHFLSAITRQQNSGAAGLQCNVWLLRCLHLQRIKVPARSCRLTNSSCYFEWLSSQAKQQMDCSGRGCESNSREDTLDINIAMLGFNLALPITLVTMQHRRIQMLCLSRPAFKANLPRLSPCCALMQCDIWIIHTIHVFVRPLQTGPHRTATSAFPAFSS